MVGIILLSRFPKGHPLFELDAHYLLLLQEGWADFIKGTVWRLVRVAVDALNSAVQSAPVWSVAAHFPQVMGETLEMTLGVQFKLRLHRHLSHTGKISKAYVVRQG